MLIYFQESILITTEFFFFQLSEKNNYFIGRNFKNAVALFVARKKSLFCPFFWSETSGND